MNATKRQDDQGQAKRLAQLEMQLERMATEGLVVSTMVNREKRYELTPQGHQLWSMILEEGTRWAGREVNGDNLVDALNAARLELGKRDLDFKVPIERECFLRQLQAACN